MPSDRLLYPLRRTRPKGDPDPGWQRISWDEALDETAAALRRIAAESGPEAVAFGVTTSSGTAMSDAQPWVDRLINAFGSPNNCNSMEICAWHRQFARAFTTGTGIGTPDYAEAGCILLWGHNPSTSLLAGATRIAAARARGAKLIVIDPRHIGFAVKADCWLPVRPGTDAALALALAGIMIDEGLVRCRVRPGLDERPVPGARGRRPAAARRRARGGRRRGSSPGTRAQERPSPTTPAARASNSRRCGLRCAAGLRVAGRDGPIACRPAFDLYAAQCRAMPPDRAAAICGVEPATIREAARLLWQHRPVAHYTWTGLEQQSNATQTDRAIAILHALTGSIDVAGGNVHLAQVPVNDVSGIELRDPAQWRKALGLAERPLGLGSSGWILSDDLYRAIVDAEPYKVRALVGFGLNLLLSHADAARGAEALQRLEFHVQTDLYLTPTAAYADIVLPVASAWEREGLRVGFGLDQDACELVQLRPAVVAPRGEARADIDIVFDLAVRLGLGNHFWHGDIEAALDYHLAPSGLSVQALRAAPRGIRVPLETAYRKYRSGGFATPSGEDRDLFRDAAGDRRAALAGVPRALFAGARLSADADRGEDTALLPQPASQPRPAAPAWSRIPLPRSARRRRRLADIRDGDWLAIATPRGRVRARARLNARLADGIVAARHGWWQACAELGLPGYDALGPDGANINLVIGADAADPVSGAASHRCYPCEISRLTD